LLFPRGFRGIAFPHDIIHLQPEIPNFLRPPVRRRRRRPCQPRSFPAAITGNTRAYFNNIPDGLLVSGENTPATALLPRGIRF
jgi:hypothetical protein